MPRNSRGRETDGDPHPPDRRPLRLIGSSSDSLLERDGFEATVPCALFRWTEYRAEATRSGLETMIVSRGTDSSNPSPSSGESCKPSVPGRGALRRSAIDFVEARLEIRRAISAGSELPDQGSVFCKLVRAALQR